MISFAYHFSHLNLPLTIRTGGAPSPATEHEYAYDPIGNRLTSADLGESRTYTANNLNQYTGISDGVDTFVPQFDDDGDQTLIQTKTGVWSVTYNGENRPVSWSCGETNITMSFDRMGRRVSYTETVGVTTNAHRTFVYDNYLQIADNSGNRYLWDPSEPVATRPLVWLHGGNTYSYTHDGNKNVSEVVDANGTVTAHYEYAPFGDVTVSAGNLASSTPFRFSSEYADDALGLVYYNYRHYDPVTGRWTSRDLIEEFGGINIYCMIGNFPAGYTDFLGFENLCDCIEITVTSVYRCNWRYFTYADYDFNPVNKGQSVPYFIDDTGLFGLKHKDRIMWVSVEVVPKEIQGTEKCHCEDIYYGAYKHCPIVVIKSMNGITKERVWNIVFNMNGESTYDRYITQYVPEYESPFISPYSITVYIDDDICEKLEFSISY